MAFNNNNEPTRDDVNRNNPYDSTFTYPSSSSQPFSMNPQDMQVPGGHQQFSTINHDFIGGQENADLFGSDPAGVGATSVDLFPRVPALPTQEQNEFDLDLERQVLTAERANLDQYHASLAARKQEVEFREQNLLLCLQYNQQRDQELAWVKQELANEQAKSRALRSDLVEVARVTQRALEDVAGTIERGVVDGERARASGRAAPETEEERGERQERQEKARAARALAKQYKATAEAAAAAAAAGV